MKRKDTWSTEDDLLLAESVLEFVKAGKSQLEAFQHAATKLNRTAAACGFRWNAEVRKRYEQELQQAKLDKKNNKTKPAGTRKKVSTIVAVEANTLEAKEDPFVALSKAIEAASSAYRELQKENEKLQRANAKLEKKLQTQTNSGDLQALMQLMERARELGIMKNESPAV